VADAQHAGADELPAFAPGIADNSSAEAAGLVLSIPDDNDDELHGYGASGSAHTAAAQGLLPDAPGPRLKKTGTPDMRCKENRTVLDSGGGASGTTAASESVGQIVSPGRMSSADDPEVKRAIELSLSEPCSAHDEDEDLNRAIQESLTLSSTPTSKPPTRDMGSQVCPEKKSQRIIFQSPGDQKFNQLATVQRLSSSAYDTLLNAHAEPSQLPITFASSDTSVLEVADGQMVICGAGRVTVTASQPGNDEYSPAANVSHTIAVKRMHQTRLTIPHTGRLFDAHFQLATRLPSVLGVSRLEEFSYVPHTCPLEVPIDCFVLDSPVQ
jgi:hypothetical protein